MWEGFEPMTATSAVDEKDDSNDDDGGSDSVR